MQHEEIKYHAWEYQVQNIWEINCWKSAACGIICHKLFGRDKKNTQASALQDRVYLYIKQYFVYTCMDEMWNGYSP